MTTPMPVFRTPYDVRFSHGTSAYMAISPSERTSGYKTNEHPLGPGTYRIKGSYQTTPGAVEALTVQFNGLNAATTGAPDLRGRGTSPTVTVIVKDGEVGIIRCITTPSSTTLADKSGVASVSIMPAQTYKP